MPVLSNLRCADVRKHPYPHVLVRNALDDAFCDKLIGGFPPVETVAQGAKTGSNRRFSYSASKSLYDNSISPEWKDLVRQHVGQEFLRELVSVFGASIREAYPDFERRFGNLESLRAGVRGMDDFHTADILLDAQICVNTPVVDKETSVRGPHVDKPDKLFAGLLYLRHPDDDSRGGDLQLFSAKDSRHIRFWEDHTSFDYVEAVETVRYERNMLVLLLNGLGSIHGVTPRSITKHPRLFLNLVAEVREPLFDLRPYQWTLMRRAIARLGMGRHRRVGV